MPPRPMPGPTPNETTPSAGRKYPVASEGAGGGKYARNEGTGRKVPGYSEGIGGGGKFMTMTEGIGRKYPVATEGIGGGKAF